MRIDLDVIQKASFEQVPKKNWPSRTISDRYRIQGRVGQGKYGVKYRIQSSGHPYAVGRGYEEDQLGTGSSRGRSTNIILFSSLCVLHQFPITAMREIRFLQNMDHPNIVKLLEVATQRDGSRDTTYLVLEYMEHDFQSLTRSVKFDARQLKCVMKQFLDGLNYLHLQNLYHRDLKPNNILYNNRGQLKICDFGMANKMKPLQTRRIQIAQYRAPEVFLGSHNINNQYLKVDIWSAGVFFLELCLGREQGLFSFAPTENQCFQQIMEKCGTPDEDSYPGVTRLPFYGDFVKNHHERSLRQYIHQCSNVSLDPETVDLIDRMLVVNPSDRISAEEALNHAYFTTFPEASSLSELFCFKIFNRMPRLEIECNHQTVQAIQRKKSSRKSKSQKQQTKSQKQQQQSSQQQINQQKQQQQQQRQIHQQQQQKQQLHQHPQQQQNQQQNQHHQQQQHHQLQQQQYNQQKQQQQQQQQVQQPQQNQYQQQPQQNQQNQQMIGTAFSKTINQNPMPRPQLRPPNVFQKKQNISNIKQFQQPDQQANDNKQPYYKPQGQHQLQKQQKFETKVGQCALQAPQPINIYCQQIVNYYSNEKPFKNPFFDNQLQK